MIIFAPFCIVLVVLSGERQLGGEWQANAFSAVARELKRFLLAVLVAREILLAVLVAGEMKWWQF